MTKQSTLQDQSIRQLNQELFRLLDALNREPSMQTPADLQQAAISAANIFIADDALRSDINYYARNETLEQQTDNRIRSKARVHQPPLRRNMRLYQPFRDEVYPSARYEAAQYLTRLFNHSIEQLQRQITKANDRADAALAVADSLDELITQIKASPEGEEIGWLIDKGVAKVQEIRTQVEHYRQFVSTYATTRIEEAQARLAECQAIERPANMPEQSDGDPQA